MAYSPIQIEEFFQQGNIILHKIEDGVYGKTRVKLLHSVMCPISCHSNGFLVTGRSYCTPKSAQALGEALPGVGGPCK